MKLKEIINSNHTICNNYLNEYNNAWEIIPDIKNLIIKIGKNLDSNKFTKKENNIWIAKNVKIDDNVKIIGPCIIDENTIVKHGSYIRENVIIGKNCIISNSSEIKNSLIYDECQLPHFNYIGDSILGYKSHLGAGSIITNLRLDKSPITIKDKQKIINTGLNKMGAIIGENVEIGANSVIYPGTIIKQNTIVYPLTKVRGIIEKNSIIKN